MNSYEKKRLKEFRERASMDYFHLSKKGGMDNLKSMHFYDHLEAFILETIQQVREEDIEHMRKYNDILYKGDAWMLTNAFLSIYKMHIKLNSSDIEGRELCGCEADEQGITHTTDAHELKENK